MFYAVVYAIGMIATVWVFATGPRAMVRGSWLSIILLTVVWPGFVLLGLASYLLPEDR